ncbi:MAG: HNH endonuclease [Alphaproteobacteria bacterium]|nr:HNH endonuclease [Alphaproteobacteria bacterium]
MLTDAEVLERLRALARAKGGALTERDLARNGAPSRGLLERRFGSWRAALAAAGIPVQSASQRYTDEECFANLARLWRHHGRAPRVVDADRAPSRIGSAAYLRRAGTWRRAIAAFAAFTGRDPARSGSAARSDIDPALGLPPRPGRDAATPAGTEPSPRAARRSGHTTPLGATPLGATPLSLRFAVLQRDRFRCTACGNSPAVDPACRLHADHIVPRSAGGRTEAANLRSLCAACNLGRGDRVASGETPPRG